MEHVTPRHVTNGSTAGNNVFYAVRTDSCHEIMEVLEAVYSVRPVSNTVSYEWRFATNHFVLVPSPLRLTVRDIFAAELLM
jgi:hypothetical protein